MQNLQNELIDLLKHEDNLVVGGYLNKNKIIELALKVEPQLIILLIKNPIFKKHFFQEVENVLVFDKIKFQRFVNNKSFLPDSYTAFKNKIGLTINDDTTDNFISSSNDVVLAWPHKDCVLEGGQTKEDQKRNEIFWNETLAPDSVDRLLDPKVLTNFKKFDKDGEHDVAELKGDENLIIKGNNLLAISSLLKTHRGKIKLICIDPPYNKGGDDFNYNDNFNHSTWLTFIKTRLIISRELLHADGSIFIFCDDSEHAYLKVLCDEIFNRDAFVSTVVWRNSDNSNNDAKQFSQDHNYVLVYAKNDKWESYNIERDDDQSSHYRNPDNDPRGPWFDGNPLNSPSPRKNLMYNIEAPNGNIINHPPNGWRWDKKNIEEKILSGEIKFNENNTNIKRRTYLNEQKGLPPSTLWKIKDDQYWLNLKETGHTRQAKFEQKKLFPIYPTSDLFKTPKPEKVIEKIINISTNEGDFVLDFFAGSGTTAAVALKMGRKFITVEQMDYINTFTVPRLFQVINGEQGGISENVKWGGGGTFVYAELMQYNQKYIDLIQEADTKERVIEIWNEMQDTAFLAYQFDKFTFNDHLDTFKTAPIHEMKQYLTELLDKNQLYVNYSEIEDDTFGINQEDKALNKQFYTKR